MVYHLKTNSVLPAWKSYDDNDVRDYHDDNDDDVYQCETVPKMLNDTGTFFPVANIFDTYTGTFSVPNFSDSETFFRYQIFPIGVLRLFPGIIMYISIPQPPFCQHRAVYGVYPPLPLPLPYTNLSHLYPHPNHHTPPFVLCFTFLRHLAWNWDWNQLANANLEIKLHFQQRMMQEGSKRFSLFGDPSGKFQQQIMQFLGAS